MFGFGTAVKAFRRSPLLSALSVTTIAFSLFAFGLFGLVALNIRNALQQVEERVEIRAFVADATPLERITTASDEIAKYPEVARADIVERIKKLGDAGTTIVVSSHVLYEIEALTSEIVVIYRGQVLAEGNVIHVGAERLEVATACNGLSMLVTLGATVTALVQRGDLGRKTGRGFYRYGSASDQRERAVT